MNASTSLNGFDWERADAQRLRALLQEFGLTGLLDTRFTLPADNGEPSLA